jgi:prepilin-type N-terminal cleavage/methylation domain-containing protein
MSPDAEVAGAPGFTLIELLIVIAIVGLLAGVLLPSVLGGKDAANEAATEAAMIQLDTGAASFNRAHGHQPPDNLKPIGDAGGKAAWKTDNGQNTGIESLVVFLSQSRKDGADLAGLGERMPNTDNDDHGAELPLLKRRDRVEIADAWGMPFAYFSRVGAGFDKAQQVTSPEGDTQSAKAKRRADGNVYGAGKLQLLSAGKDGKFNTDDDLVWPKN